MGVQLAREARRRRRRHRADPRLGRARGHRLRRRASDVPFELGIIRNHYVGRTFIEPEQRIRAARRQAQAFGECQRHPRQPHRARSTTASCAAPPPRRSCSSCTRPAPAKCTCASPRRRSRTPTTTASTRPSKIDLLAANKDLEGMRAVPRRRQPRLPLRRRHLPRGRATTTATRAARSSPTIASPASTRPHLPIKAGKPCHASSRCWQRSAEPPRLSS